MASHPEHADPTPLEDLCAQRGMRMTDQRRVIARVLDASTDHPDVEELYARASAIDPHISMSTVYRTMKLFEESGIVARLDFGDGRARYEQTPDEHHDHLIDVTTGQVIEFTDPDIEALQEKIAERLGYKLVDHRLELFGRPIARKADTKTKPDGD
ncbi:MAG: Fur family transcriptional regulator [Pseudomonadota bacterium]